MTAAVEFFIVTPYCVVVEVADEMQEGWSGNLASENFTHRKVCCIYLASATGQHPNSLTRGLCLPVH